MDADEYLDGDEDDDMVSEQLSEEPVDDYDDNIGSELSLGDLEETLDDQQRHVLRGSKKVVTLGIGPGRIVSSHQLNEHLSDTDVQLIEFWKLVPLVKHPV
ncbi:hypothetical protein F0562_006239 [Nyssa sinensis]|uniref:Uncharacterized protein n=1 Tax=Nyssa sinensis TaxID=561372 RepID=A0A5J5ALC9_9ASTE|nr:hypothetical protein F0562_006239 [Nyssa sinensis]